MVISVVSVSWPLRAFSNSEDVFALSIFMNSFHLMRNRYTLTYALLELLH